MSTFPTKVPYKAANYAEARRVGRVSLAGDGKLIERQAVISRVLLGNHTPIVFSIDYDIKGRYAVIDADDLQPSHLGSSQNPLHFIPEAQPRNRSTSASGALTPERIARNLRPDELLYSTTAYTGAPVVNSRGEVIQGNGRAYALKLYYQQFPTDDKGYKQAIDDGNYRFGFLLYKETLRKLGIKKPVLVRMVDVPDRMAIELGQFTQADTEAVATSVTKIKSKARLLKKDVLKRILNEITRNDNDDKTLAELIRESNVLKVLIKEGVIRNDDLENYTRNGTINEAGVEFVSSLLLNTLFRGGDVNTPDVFALLPVATQNAVKKSTLFLLKCSGSKSLNMEVSNAILAYREYLASGAATLSAWLNQFDLQGQTPASRYTPLELAIVDLFHKAKTQKEVVAKFRQYATLVNDQPGNMFEDAKKGMSKREAAKAVFNVKYRPDVAKALTGQRASRTLRSLRNRTITKRRSTKSTSAPIQASSLINSDTPMTTAEKEAFSKRMAKGRAKAAKTKARKSATKAKKSTDTKPKAKKKATKKATSVRKRATTKKVAKSGRKKTATKKAETAKTTVRVKSRKDQKGKNFIQEVDKLADRIHEKSATGEFVQVPVYGISRSKAKAKAFKALSATRKAKNVTNVRLKV